MRFEEVLPALREGKCARQIGHRFPWAYMKMIDGELHWCSFGPYTDPFKARLDDVSGEWELVDEAAMADLRPKPTHRCGRRGPWDPNSPFRHDSAEVADYYHELGGEERCSYCGSVSGDSFMAFIEAGGEVGPTDKNYKAYLHDVKAADGSVTLKAPGLKFYFQHLSDEQQTRFIELLNARKVKIGLPGHFYALPYFCKRVS